MKARNAQHDGKSRIPGHLCARGRRRAFVVLLAGLTGTCAQADMRVFWLVNGDHTSIHRFAVTGEGTADETWTETTPLVTFGENVKVGNVFPAHGGYYVCFMGNGTGSNLLKYNQQVHRYDKNGNHVGLVGTFQNPSVHNFEMSADQAWIFGSNWSASKGQNCISRLHLGTGACMLTVTNNLNRARCLSWGADGLLYAASRADGTTDYAGNTLVSGTWKGVQAFDVSNGGGGIFKHFYAGNCQGGCIADTVRNRICMVCAADVKIFGRSEEAPDGERSDAYRAVSATVSKANAFSGALLGGRPYTVDYNTGKVFRVNDDDTVTEVATITETTISGEVAVMKNVYNLREDVFPENDTTLALTRLGDYWSFNSADNADVATKFKSLVHPERGAALASGFTAGVRGAVREGLWCAAGAHGTLGSAELVPQSGDFSIVFFAGFPQALAGAQTLMSNPKMTVSVTATGYLAAALSDGTAVTGTTALADGAWHQLAVVRRENVLELWVDGAQDGVSAETACTIYDNANTQWSLLSATNPNPMFLDDLRVYDAALTKNDIDHLRALATDGLAVPSDPTGLSDAAASSIGVVVAHSATHAWGVPSVVADVDGTTLYVAADFARGKGENNQTVFWKSVDAGQTWTRYGSEASLCAMALFRYDTDISGRFRAVALESEWYRAWGLSSFDGCDTWKDFYRQSATPLEEPWYPTFAVPGVIRSLAAPQGIYSTDSVRSGQGTLAKVHSNLTNKFHKTALVSGGMMRMSANGAPVGLYPQSVVLPAHVTCTNSRPPEALSVLLRNSTNETTGTVRGAANFPGASRPFGLVFDAASGCWWAAVSYVAGDTSTPWTQANRLALWCAETPMKWQFCGDILEAGTPDAVGFNNPNVAVCGSDLVVVFGASVHDRTGATGPRDVNRSNYILSTRVANFRARRPEERLARTLLVGDQSAGRIVRYCEDAETGEWRPSGYFADGSYNGNSLAHGDDIKYVDDSVWVLRNGRIFRFAPDGTFLDMPFVIRPDALPDVVPYAPEIMGFSYDGRYIYTIFGFAPQSDARKKYIYRSDRTTGTTIQLASSDDPDLGDRLYRTRAVTGLPDGTLAVACRDGNTVFRLNADGSFREDIWTSRDSPAMNSPQTFHFDRRAQKLYITGFSSKLFVWDYRTGAKKNKDGLPGILCITGDDRGTVYGTAYDSPAGCFDLLADDGAFTVKGCRALFYGDLNYFRCCFFDPRPSPGTIFLFR